MLLVNSVSERKKMLIEFRIFSAYRKHGHLLQERRAKFIIFVIEYLPFTALLIVAPLTGPLHPAYLAFALSWRPSLLAISSTMNMATTMSAQKDGLTQHAIYNGLCKIVIQLSSSKAEKKSGKIL